MSFPLFHRNPQSDKSNFPETYNVKPAKLSNLPFSQYIKTGRDPIDIRRDLDLACLCLLKNGIVRNTVRP